MVLKGPSSTNAESTLHVKSLRQWGASEYQVSCSHPTDVPALQDLKSPILGLNPILAARTETEVVKAKDLRTAKQELPILENEM